MRARKIDANLPTIRGAAQAAGFRVHTTNADWDLTVQMGDKTELWECKNGKGRITDRQRELAQKGWKIRTVRTVDDVLEARKRLK